MRTRYQEEDNERVYRAPATKRRIARREEDETINSCGRAGNTKLLETRFEVFYLTDSSESVITREQVSLVFSCPRSNDSLLRIRSRKRLSIAILRTIVSTLHTSFIRQTETPIFPFRKEISMTVYHWSVCFSSQCLRSDVSLRSC